MLDKIVSFSVRQKFVALSLVLLMAIAGVFFTHAITHQFVARCNAGTGFV